MEQSPSGKGGFRVRFAGINDLARQWAFRSVPTKNGTVPDGGAARSLCFDEVQVSLDGMKEGHDCVRGERGASSGRQAASSAPGALERAFPWLRWSTGATARIL